jgi:hypothetical protein
MKRGHRARRASFLIGEVEPWLAIQRVAYSDFAGTHHIHPPDFAPTNDYK